MGFFDDVGVAINQAAINVGQTAATVATAPFEFARDAVTGRPLDQAFGDKAKRLFAAASAAVVDPIGLAGTDAGQNLFRNKDLNQFTFGYLDDYAGTTRATRDANQGYDVQQSDWNSAGRWAVKSAAIGIGAAASGAKGTQWYNPETKESIGLFGQNVAKKVPELTLANYGIGLSASSALSRGDVKSIGNLFGLPAPISNLLPSTPVAPPSIAPRTMQPASSNPWSSFTSGGSSQIPTGSSNQQILWIGAAAVLGAIILARTA